MDNKEIEIIELRYLNEINWHFTNEMDKIIKLLQTKDIIKDHWKHIFDRKDKKSQTGEMSRGVERVFGAFFPNTWLPNSTPVGADFMFETIDSIIHVDTKTAKLDNEVDHRGKVALSLNQTSYYLTIDDRISGNLPQFYNLPNSTVKKKLTTTYMIHTVYDEKDYTVCCIVLICVPNGQLHSVYGDDIMDRGKAKDNSFRYRYGDQTFRLLNGHIPRYTVPFCKSKEIKHKITSLKL